MRSRPRVRTAVWRLLRGKPRREDGQALIIAVLALVVLLAMAGLAIDIGRAYVAQRQLQAAVDAAALAASQDLPDPVNAQTTANSYSAMPGAQNERPGLTASSPIVKPICLTTIPGSTTPTNVPCQTYPGPANSSGYRCNPCNAVTVSESGSIGTTFLGVVGLGNLFQSVQSSSTVIMRGGTPHPLDVMVVLDVSSSMNQACTDANNTAYRVAGMTTTSSKLDCAKEGIRSLISNLWPCDASLSVCPTPNTNPLDSVGLEIFPGVTSGVMTPEFDCSWTLTTADMGYSNSSGYDAVPLSSDFRQSDSGGFVGTSPLVEATSWSSCNQGTFPPGTAPPNSKYGAEAPNCSGPCTFFADALFNAALKIQADQTNRLQRTGVHAQGVIILLSDGDANTQGPNACKAAVDTAQTVAIAPYNDWVFSVGYDIPSSGCSTDTAANEVERITLTGATGGSYTLSFNGSAPTGPIAPTATSTTVQTALRGLSTINGANVNVTGANGGPYTVTFVGALAAQDVPQLVANGALLTPAGTAQVAVTTTTPGSASTGYTPFTTMSSIASDPTKFYCLHPPNGQTCNGASAANLNQIFKDIGIAITGARVVATP